MSEVISEGTTVPVDGSSKNKSMNWGREHTEQHKFHLPGLADSSGRTPPPTCVCIVGEATAHNHHRRFHVG